VATARGNTAVEGLSFFALRSVRLAVLEVDIQNVEAERHMLEQMRRLRLVQRVPAPLG